MRGNSTSQAWIVLVAVGLSACSDSATEPELLGNQMAAVAAAVAADAVLEDLSVMDEVVPRFGGPALMEGAGTHRIRERTVTFFDADGNEQEAFDPIATASIHTVVQVEGEISRENLTASMQRHRDMWVTGLEGEEETRIWNGEGSSSHERVRVSDEFGERSYGVEAWSTIDDVVRSVDREANPWPLSGTITRVVEVTVVNGPNGDRNGGRTVVITFDGTRFAKVEMDGSVVGDVDLSTREGRNPMRRRGA